MPDQGNFQMRDGVIATIENRQDPSQSIAIKYIRAESAFVTSGIEGHLGTKEILVPVHLIALDFQLMGAIIAAVLEKISLSCEKGATFQYPSHLDVMGRRYTLSESGEYMKLDAAPEEPSSSH
ncbi:MAG: hypothetical protein JW821_08535 [Deltaproteobacteria bacterium]|nr:hypothetical protein [Deltaproteobacteria bacterium]